MNAKLMKFLRDEDGVTAIEYGLIAGLIAVAIIVGATNIGSDLTSIFGNIDTQLKTAVPTKAP
ncbi:pilus assembly protein Flp/PilA [Collimonas sp. OK607]|uniref:Flp family type IVb pilin n=1 Tax=Collimonas sp. OK607 TaxID=1798194 RepID=UPI0008E4C1C6|nr:Flp family type IVb pilin [Collimonas sp. OK607]SFA80619.1 pilus assembly protein Flp/PilA [Collimonas sp. OK607]